MKKIIPLNDSWLYGRGFTRSCLEQDFDFGGFFPVSLPHNNCELEGDYSDFGKMQTVSTYTRLLMLDEKYNGSRLKLCFDGIISYAELYVNGMFVTSHKGDTPFSADITAPVKYGYENRIVLKVDSRFHGDVPCSGGCGPMPAYGGIHRQIWLSVVSGGEIADAFVKTSFISEAASEVTIDVTLGDYYPDTSLSAEILDSEGKTAAALTPKAVLSRSVTLSGTAADVRLWSDVSPELYTAVITLRSGDRAEDVMRVTFGFRTAVFKRDGFYLNGKRVKLIGLNRMDCYPVIGRAATEHLQRMDASVIRRRLGCNVVRLHGLASRYFIDECNRIGLMVIEDLSGDGYIGGAAWRETLVAGVEDMVRRDRNNPAVIAWGVRVNDSADCDELYFKTNRAAREADPTRATVGSRSFMGSRMYEDVFAFNDYPGERTLSRLGKTTKLFVPYFISEHTGRTFPAKSYDTEKRLVEQAHRHLAVIDKVTGSRKITGCAGMAFADFDALPGQSSGDGAAHYGVVDEYRFDKTAAFAYASQSDEAPYLEISSLLAPDEFGGRLLFYTNCDSVKLYCEDCLTGEFFPDKKRYPHLRHAPVEVRDLIGLRPVESDKLTPLQNKVFKYVMRAAEKRGGLLNLRALSRLAAFLLRKSLKADEETFKKLADKYRCKGRVFKAEGIIGGECVITRVFGCGIGGNRLRLTASAAVVRPSSSYETVLITAAVRDAEGNLLNYDFSPVSIAVEGEAILLGDNIKSLKAGRTGFFVTTTPYDGKALISVTSRWGTETIELEVRHERVEKL